MTTQESQPTPPRALRIEAQRLAWELGTDTILVARRVPHRHWSYKIVTGAIPAGWTEVTRYDHD